MQLEKLGYAADAVTDGRQALAALQRAAYDIILMDCQMPGWTATKRPGRFATANRTGEDFRNGAPHIYIIAMTANTEADNRGNVRRRAWMISSSNRCSCPSSKRCCSVRWPTAPPSRPGRSH